MEFYYTLYFAKVVNKSFTIYAIFSWFIRLLINNEDCKLIAVHKARYYKRTEGLSLGPGPFVEALEYASGKKATVVGKPQLEFFQSVLQEFSCSAEETVMIGDVSVNCIISHLAFWLHPVYNGV